MHFLLQFWIWNKILNKDGVVPHEKITNDSTLECPCLQRRAWDVQEVLNAVDRLLEIPTLSKTTYNETNFPIG